MKFKRITSIEQSNNQGDHTVSVIAMEEKKAQHAQESRAKEAFEFVGDIKSEFTKITWTSREELRVYTKAVVIATFLFGMAVYFVDILIQYGLFALDFMLRFITG